VDARRVLLRFDEEISPVPDSCVAEPQAELSCFAQDKDLTVTFALNQSPGADYALAGEVDDKDGNRTRFFLKFTGWNDRAPHLLISEVQTGKNGSKTKPHRDFIEFVVVEDGNVGGEELSWASSIKSATYRFPGIEVRKGDFLVLHLAPEGLPEEIDELGEDISASGGVDATSTGRDLWCSTMPLPDESGAISLSLRSGEAPIDGLFYVSEDKSGTLSSDKLQTILSGLAAAGVWQLSSSTLPAWEDGFKWKSSSARSICRSGAGKGPGYWYVTAASGQTPGAVNSSPEPLASAKATRERAASNSVEVALAKSP
jgi:hypothetical protein